MTIESKNVCDGCNVGMDDGDYAYCQTCIDGKDEEIKELEQTLGNKDSEINDLESDVQKHLARIDELEGLYEK